MSGVGWRMKLIGAALLNRPAAMVPPGWKLVPVEMTTQMHKACKKALYEHLLERDGFRPKSDRKKQPGRIDGRTKQDLRWRATLEAAPPCKSGDF